MLIDPFETERLAHRPLAPEDVDEMARLHADPQTMRYIGQGQPRTHAQTRELLEFVLGQYRDYRLGLFATLEKATGRFVGRCGIIVWHIQGVMETEVAYLIDRACWGRGYATEAAGAFLAKALAHPAWPTDYVVSFIRPENAASLRVAEKIGLAFWKERTLMGLPVLAYRKDLRSGAMTDSKAGLGN
jgi:ribosomal-protein-alanine N-acetyltransferase